MINKLPKKYWPILLLVVVNLIVWTAYINLKDSGEMKVSFLDVGQGDAIFIEAPNGRQMLIDGGANASVLNGLGGVMSFFDRSIDIVLATHPDKDHVGGLPFVLDRYKVKIFIDSLADGDAGAYRKLEDMAKEQGIETYYGLRGDIIMLDETNGVYIHVLYPEPDEFKIDETNEMSIITKLVYGDTSVMLTGDAGKVPERLLSSNDKDYLRSAVLKAGHHGSKTSSLPSFIKAVSPQYVVISAGANNSYGHPHPETIKTLKDNGAEILETAEKGTITFVSNGIDIWPRK